MPKPKRSNSSSAGLKPLLQALVENGGLATTKSKRLSWPLNGPWASVKYGAERLLSFQMVAVSQLCKIMFILAKALVALSISWP
ncbi:hypothetical protein D3C81_2194970 [compost metagenome]